jgi:hypothetical protein
MAGVMHFTIATVLCRSDLFHGAGLLDVVAEYFPA